MISIQRSPLLDEPVQSLCSRCADSVKSSAHEWTNASLICIAPPLRMERDESRVRCRIDYFLLRFFFARVTSQSTTAITPMTKMMKADDRNELSPIKFS